MNDYLTASVEDWLAMVACIAYFAAVIAAAGSFMIWNAFEEFYYWRRRRALKRFGIVIPRDRFESGMSNEGIDRY